MCKSKRKLRKKSENEEVLLILRNIRKICRKRSLLEKYINGLQVKQIRQLTNAVQYLINNDSHQNRAKLKRIVARLSPIKEELRALAEKASVSAKKKKIIQLGGGFGTIAAILIPLITSLFTKRK